MALKIVFRLTLLWYHTIIRPFFALDDKQDAGEYCVMLKLLSHYLETIIFYVITL